MAGSAISRALTREGYGDPARGGALLTPTHQQLDLLDGRPQLDKTNRPDVQVLAAATVGGIEANRVDPPISYSKTYASRPTPRPPGKQAPAGCCFSAAVASTPNLPSNQSARKHCSPVLEPTTSGTPSPKLPASSSRRPCAASTALMPSA